MEFTGSVLAGVRGTKIALGQEGVTDQSESWRSFDGAYFGSR